MKKKSLILLGLLILFAAYFLGSPSNNMEGELIEKILKPEKPDLGDRNITFTSGVNSRVLDGSKTGRFFIVTGKVINNYSNPRSFIQVSSSLYTEGKMLAKTVRAYCGNIISDLELKNMNLQEIQAQMENRSGKLGTNIGVGPGEERPFMIVFSDLPENLEEFTVTVIGSSVSKL